MRDCGRDEDDAAREVEDEDPAGTHEAHQESTDEAAEGETALGAGEELGGGGVGVFGVGVGDVVDELGKVRCVRIDVSDGCFWGCWEGLTKPAMPTCAPV